jgi:hypothetical protein
LATRGWFEILAQVYNGSNHTFGYIQTNKKGPRTSTHFSDRVLRKIFGTVRKKVAADGRNLHNKKFHNLYCSPSIIRVIKSGKIRWPGHVLCVEEYAKFGRKT